MPSADELLQTFATPKHPSPPPDEEDPWGFDTPPSATEHLSVGKKKKSKKKLKKNAALALLGPPAEPVRVEDTAADESVAYTESAAPSPPREEQGVKLHAHSEPTTTVSDTSPLAGEPLVSFDDDDSPPMDDVEPVPARAPSTDRYPPTQSPPTRSPRPAIAEPALYSRTSPSTRPAILHNRHGSISSNAHRPSSALRSHQLPPRRESLTAATPFPRFVEPPPPHMPQAHFFGLPDFALNLTRKPETGRPAGSDGYCCSLDSLADAGNEVSARKSKDVLLVGSDGGMEIYKVLPGKLEVVGRVEGLRGAVMKAKIIPCPDRFDPLQSLRPLVAVVVHGPVQAEADVFSDDDDDEPRPRQYQTTVEVYSLQKQTHFATLYRSATVTAGQPVYNQVSSLPGPIGDLQLAANGRYIVVTSGQSGEVFVFTHYPTSGMEHFRYRCIGKFWTSLQRAVGAHTRSSGTDAGGSSGEVNDAHHDPLFSLGQRWLALVPPALSPSTSILGSPLLSEVNPGPPGVGTHAAPPQPPITCEVTGTDVEDAWVRLGRQAAQGLVKYSQYGIQMGLNGWKELTQPSPPGSGHARNPSKEDLFPPTKGPSEDPSRLSREPALVSLIDLDTLLQWEEYKPKHVPLPMATFILADGCNFLSLSSTGTRLLTTSRKGETSLVWDLSQVAHGIVRHAQPADDPPPTGPCVKQLLRIARSTPSTVLSCAWSRDSDALALLTAHGTLHLHEIPSRPLPRKRTSAARQRPSPNSPSLEKSNPTTSLSLGLSPPSSNSSFLTTLKSSWQNVSTHVNSLRSGGNGTGSSDSAGPTGGSRPGNAFALPKSFAGFRDATAAAGNAGSRAVARGLTQGFAVAKDGASDYWHADDNKIRLKGLVPSTTSTPSTSNDSSGLSGSGSTTGLGTSMSSVRWMRRSSLPALAIACGGKVHICPVSRVVRRKGDSDVSGLKSERYARKTFALPTIAGPGIMSTMAHEGESGGRRGRKESCGDMGPHGFWSLSGGAAAVYPPPLPLSSSPLPQPSHGSFASPSSYPPHMPSPHARIPGPMDVDDVETNPPYCPFHVDTCVAIHAFDGDLLGRDHDSIAGTVAGSLAPIPSLSASLHVFITRGHGLDEDPWLFGGSLPSSSRVNDSEGGEGSVLGPFSHEGGIGREAGSGTEFQTGRALDARDPGRGLDEMGFGDDGDEDDDVRGGGEEAQVESTTTIRRSRRRSGGAGQIDINTRRRPRDVRGDAGRNAVVEAEGEGDAEWGMMDEI